MISIPLPSLAPTCARPPARPPAQVSDPTGRIPDEVVFSATDGGLLLMEPSESDPRLTQAGATPPPPWTTVWPWAHIEAWRLVLQQHDEPVAADGQEKEELMDLVFIEVCGGSCVRVIEA